MVQKKILFTNLTKKEATPQELKELYHTRWKIETNYDRLKNKLNIWKLLRSQKNPNWTRSLLHHNTLQHPHNTKKNFRTTNTKKNKIQQQKQIQTIPNKHNTNLRTTQTKNTPPINITTTNSRTNNRNNHQNNHKKPHIHTKKPTNKPRTKNNNNTTQIPIQPKKTLLKHKKHHK